MHQNSVHVAKCIRLKAQYLESTPFTFTYGDCGPYSDNGGNSKYQYRISCQCSRKNIDSNVHNITSHSEIVPYVIETQH